MTDKPPMPPPGAGDRVGVSPVYLAGPGDLRIVTSILRRAPGWTRADTGDAALYYTSPCQRIRIAFNSPTAPEFAASMSGGWKIASSLEPLYAPEWMAHFSPATPGEIIAAVVTRLVHPNASGADGEEDHRPPGEALADQGWTARTGTNLGWALEDRVLSRDGLASFAFLQGDTVSTDPTAIFTGGRGWPAAHRWQAEFTDRTPWPLVNAAVAAFANPAPVERASHQIPPPAHDHITVTPPAWDSRALSDAAEPAPTSQAPRAPAELPAPLSRPGDRSAPRKHR